MPQSETALDHEVQHQSRFEELLLEIPAHFINLPGESIDDDIEDAQSRICECLNMSKLCNQTNLAYCTLLVIKNNNDK